MDIQKLLLIVPLEHIGFLLADREFVGKAWFSYLKKTCIAFCIRLKENMLVSCKKNGKSMLLKSLFQNIKTGESQSGDW